MASSSYNPFASPTASLRSVSFSADDEVEYVVQTEAPSTASLHPAPVSMPATPRNASLDQLGTPKSPGIGKRMQSYMLTAPLPKPWLAKPNPRAKISYYITWFMLFVGLALGAIQSYLTYVRVALDRQPLCLIFDEEFNEGDEGVFGTGIAGDGGRWFKEVGVGGFGNGEFQEYTNSTSNVYLKNGYLYIAPTLTPNYPFPDGTVNNVTGCTFNLTTENGGYTIPNPDPSSSDRFLFDTASYLAACSSYTNSSQGVIINPVQSARISTVPIGNNTRANGNINTGRVEFRAKMPTGDWMWPAIWMLPVDSVYGPWPRSGEIDIVESRGNSLFYTNRGSNYVQGSLNWGPSPELNGVSHSYSWWTDRRKQFNQDFHTYALEWTDSFLRIYIDTRLHTLLDMRFNEPFFKRGDFPEVIQNGSTQQALQDPWINGTNATPFDQSFYLIMNVAVGSTNSWFPDGQGNKPWIDNARHPMLDFANAQSQWYPTWPANPDDRAMVVDYVKMWKHC